MNNCTVHDWKASARFGEFCSRCCSPLLSELAFSIHATWPKPFSRALHSAGLKNLRLGCVIMFLFSRPRFMQLSCISLLCDLATVSRNLGKVQNHKSAQELSENPMKHSRVDRSWNCVRLVAWTLTLQCQVINARKSERRHGAFHRKITVFGKWLREEEIGALGDPLTYWYLLITAWTEILDPLCMKK